MSAPEQAVTTLRVTPSGPGLVMITDQVATWLASVVGRGEHGVSGLLTLLCQHTSASLTLQENASPEVRTDLSAAFDRLAPRNAGYAHDLEGPDDMPAHIRTVLSGVHLAIPVIEGRLALGTWQGVYLWEHRDHPSERRIAAHLIYGR